MGRYDVTLIRENFRRKLDFRGNYTQLSANYRETSYEYRLSQGSRVSLIYLPDVSGWQNFRTKVHRSKIEFEKTIGSQTDSLEWIEKTLCAKIKSLREFCRKKFRLIF